MRAFLALRTLIYATGFFFVLGWLFPALLKIRRSTLSTSEPGWRALGALPILIGLALMLWCVANFVVVGEGTPAPFDAPRRLVVSGPYRHVRNPMYVGGLLFLVGYALLFAEFSPVLLWYAVGLIVAVNLFILAYEEPTLRRKFNGEYREYCRNVRRWIPRIRPWRPQKQQASVRGAGN